MTRRDDILAGLAAKRAAGRAIIGAGAGTGISAKFLYKGGADLIFIYNSGRFRMQGLSSWVGHLPFGDANAIVMEMGEREVMPVVPDANVIAGVCGFDPTRRMSHFLPKVVEAGFAGVINYPTVAVIDGRMRADLEAGGLGFDKEVEMIRIACGLGLVTTAYVCTPDEAVAMIGAGVDMIVAHMGLTVGGAIGAQHAMAMDEAAKGVAAIAAASRKARSDVFVVAHGGPIAGPADAEKLFKLVEVDGFVGASSMERLPIEEPLRANTHAFTQLRTR
ncbi:MAG TPA: phosphoenolpyruvate hydrolase family protein [Devosia sp.]|jgi:predicted TIM-barrel enzyme|uniref:phosphoenolpyruvate hydrolase family protein n=1 Tax=Devosia sp. TaxID=1871048 RepID=UPI002DDD46E6|nr:phosphoenolpyruvate hydrolase family protein [Devosia sp.]HEV2514057.1 phosphoenolpyruvate hydrolase family protein [Devosia sp.]